MGLTVRSGWPVYTVPPDGGYGWVVVLSSFILQMVSLGVSLSGGVYYVELLEAFDRGKGTTAWIGSLNTGLLFGAGPISTMLTYRFGFRKVTIAGGLLSATGFFLASFATELYQLWLTCGILAGFGFGCVYVPAVVIVGLYFTKRRPLAIGLAVAGVGAGGLVVPPIQRVLITYFGWRGAYIISSGICLQMCVCAAVIRPVQYATKSEKKENKNGPFSEEIVVTSENAMLQDEQDDSSKHIHNNLQKTEICDTKPDKTRRKLFDVSLLTSIKMWTIVFSNVLWNIGSLIMIHLIPDYSRDYGVTKENGSILVAIIGLMNFIGKLAIAPVPNKKRYDRFAIYIISTFMCGVTISLVPLKPSFTTLAVYCALYGFFFGIEVAVMPVVTTAIFGVERLNSAFGLQMFGDGLGCLLGPPVAGWLYDSTKNYHIPFYFGGGVSFLSATILLPIFFCHRNTERREKMRRNIGNQDTKEGSLLESAT